MRLSAPIRKLSRGVVDHEARRIDSRQDRLSIDKHLDGRFLGTEESHSYFVETWRHRQDHTFVFVPEEVLGARIHALDLPGDRVTVRSQLARAPDPASRAVLLAKHLVELLLGGEGSLEVAPIHLLLNIFVHLLESFVYILDVYRLKKLKYVSQTVPVTYLISCLGERRHP